MSSSQILKCHNPGFAHSVNVRSSLKEQWPQVCDQPWEEINTHYLHENALVVHIYNILNDLILNEDQTPLKYVPTTNVTIAEAYTSQRTKEGTKEQSIYQTEEGMTNVP